MCVCVGVWMCGCFDNCVGVLVLRVLVFTVRLYCFVYVYVASSYLLLVCGLLPSENLIAVNNNNNNKAARA